MARIRTIKPEFWTDGDVMDLSPFARLLFIGSWNFAICDFGHVADDPRRLKMQVLPADDVDGVALVDELVATGRMVRIDVDGRSFLHIKRFTDHQKTERRWTPRCPVCASSAPAEPRKTSPNLPETPPTSTPEGKGKEGMGGEGKERSEADAPDAAEPTKSLALVNNDRLDVERICEHLAEQIEARGSKRPTITARWRNEARLLLDRDGRTEEQAHACIRWLFTSTHRDARFWRTNVRSMPKLREEYDRLRELAERPGAATTRNQEQSDLLARAMARAEARERGGA